ncbi:ornithine cyclodeaminase family protein [Subtercola sp. YIM 133946]|uniref:ornithine cyclodeaminase family protein n=1 Tax=Subtercola sp. YIM 133946 TaxID=3118909 RepID=UPI002F93C7DD
MRILSNDDVEQLLDAEDVIDSLEVAYRELADEKGANRPRNHTYFPVENAAHPGFRFRFKSQEGGNLSSGVWATRITSDMVGTETLPTGESRRRLLPVAPGGRYVGLVTLYSLDTLEPLAIMHDSVIQKFRVGATSALGVRELSNDDVTVAGMFGAGWQAAAHLETLLLVRPGIEEIRVYSPTAARREEFAATWSEKTGRKVVAVDHPRLAVEGCRIITAATAAMEPVFDGRWLEPGTHVTCITSPDGTAMRRELDDVTFDRADRIVVFSREQVHHDNQIDILGPVDRGRIAWDDIQEIGDVLLDPAPARKHPDDITIFANNTGMGIQFAAVGSRILRLAEEQDLGHVIPTEWLLEETTP